MGAHDEIVIYDVALDDAQLVEVMNCGIIGVDAPGRALRTWAALKDR